MSGIIACRGANANSPVVKGELITQEKRENYRNNFLSRDEIQSKH